MSSIEKHDDLAAPAPMVTSIRAVTHNVFGLKFLSPDKRERLDEIGRQLASADPPPQIVALQECWTAECYECVRRHTQQILPHAKFFYSGAFGGGLVIMSKWPIIESSMHRFSLNGRPTAFWRGDWFVGKGVASAKIRLGPAGPRDIVEVFCTHFHAPYEEGRPRDSYICHRISQAWEVAKLMRGAAERGHLVLGMGDFNMLPASLSHRLVHAFAPVRDAWQVVHPNSAVGPADHPDEVRRNVPIPTAKYNLTKNGAASDNVVNTFRWSKEDQRKMGRGQAVACDHEDAQDRHAKRLDYIFVGAPPSTNTSTPAWRVADVQVGMTSRHPRLKCSLSDHFSVEATLVRNNDSLSAAAVAYNRPEFTVSMYDTILLSIAAYNRRQANQGHWRSAHFFAAVLVSVGCHVAVWWSPRNFVAFLLTLLSTLGLVAGVVDGLIALLFIKTEKRALKEFEWEIRNARDLRAEHEI